jgi:hypothetical protein
MLLYVIGTINGIGYSIYIDEWPTAIGVAVLAVMAFPTVKKMYNHIFVDDI